jgi:hypothetical protein
MRIDAFFRQSDVVARRGLSNSVIPSVWCAYHIRSHWQEVDLMRRPVYAGLRDEIRPDQWWES